MRRKGRDVDTFKIDEPKLYTLNYEVAGNYEYNFFEET